MDFNALIGIVATGAIIAAIVFYLQVQKASQSALALRQEIATVQQTLEEVRKESGARKEELERIRKDHVEVNQKLREAKKKAFDNKEEAKKRTAREEDPAQVQEATSKVLYAAAEKTRARNEELNREVALLRKELAEATADRERLANDARAGGAANDEVRRLRARVTELENREPREPRPERAERPERPERPGIDPAELARYRRRSENLTAAYMVAKGKVEVTEDRLQDLLKRHTALQAEVATLKAKLAGGRKRREGAPNGAGEAAANGAADAAANGADEAAASDTPHETPATDAAAASADAATPDTPADAAALAAAAAELEASASENPSATTGA